MAITITEEMLRKADDYLSLSQKAGMAKYFAIACVEEMRSAEDSTLPPLLRERVALRQQYMMGVLAQLYLHQSFDKQKVTDIDGKKVAGVLDACMSEEAYDEWKESHVISQMNRFIRRHDGELSDKAYEIMCDWKMFGEMLDESIKALMAQNNDPLGRVARMLTAELTPEKFKELLAKVEEVNAMAEALQKEKENA